MTVLKERGLQVEERKINIDEVIEGLPSGKADRGFGTGTAATISPMQELQIQRLSHAVRHGDL